MLQFIGHTTSQLPEQVELDKEEFTIGRDAKCSLVLDSLVSPRMISRVHCILRKTQPASAAVLAGQRSLSRAASARTSSRAQVAPAPAQPAVARWMLLDQKSMNGVFVNDVKVQSTLLSHGDILTIGGLGQKIPIGTMFAQPEAEFIFRFVQSQPNAHEPDQATLPMGAFEEAAEASERTQPQESFAPAPRAASAKRAQTIVEEPAEEAAAAEEEPVEEEHKEPRSEAEEAEEEEGSTRGSDEGEPEDAAAAAGGEPGEDDAPTQILPPDPSPAGSRAASARRPTLRKQDSSAMVDATLVEAEMEVFVTAPSVRRGRSSQAPTRADSEAATQILPPDMPVSMSVRRRSSRGAAAVAPAAAAPMGLDLHAYRVAASIGATMNDIDSSFNPSLGGSDDEDADVLPHSSDVKAMELDRTASSDATQVLPASSQAATQVMASESGDASSSAAAAAAAADISASISASLLGDLGCMGMATQTQVLPAFERVPSHLLAPPPSTGRATRKSSARSALYDDDESEDDARPNSKGRRAPSSAASSSSAAAAHSSAAFASPSASASPGGARTPASSSKKKRGRDEDDEPIIIEELPSEDEDDSAANKRKKVDRKPSKRGSVAAASSSAAAAAAAMESCPLCSESVPAARLESHVNSCLRAAAVDADAEAARKLAKELEAADAADAAARKSPAKRKPAARKPDWARDKELEERARAARASGRRVVYDGMEDRDWEADYRGDHSGDDEPIDDGLAPYDAYRAEREEEDGYAFGEHPSDEEEERSRAAAGFGSSRAAAGGRKGKYRVPPSAAAAAAAAAGSPASKKKKAAPSGPKTPCPLCSKSFFQSDLAEHADICEGADEDCPKCNKPFLPSMVKAHARTCAGPDMMCALCEEMIGPKAYDAHVKRCIGRDSKACKLCNALFPEAEIAQHEKRCVQKEADMSQDEKMAIEIQRGEQQHELVSDVNTRAIKWVAEQAKRLSEAAMRPLLARFQKLGHSERDLKATIRYIRNDAPLIIHVNLTNCMKFFVADTHYRNQFETKTSCGTLSTSARTQWEDGLFNRIYHHSDGYERVKYGVCNIVCDPNGVLACRGYGDSYMLLKSSTVRLRTSFASRDTGGGTAKLASCEWYAHVLEEYSDPELLDVISVATKAKLCVSSSRISNYKEVQYHGPIEFARDVESLFVHPRHTKERDIMQMCQEFARNNNCNLVIMEADGM